MSLDRALKYGLFFGLVALFSAGSFLELYRVAWWMPAAMLILPTLLGVGYLLESRHRIRFWWEYKQLARRQTPIA